MADFGFGYVYSQSITQVDGVNQGRIKGVLWVLQHPGTQFWGPAIGVSENFLTVPTDSHYGSG